VNEHSTTSSVEDLLVTSDPDSPDNTLLLRASLHLLSGEVIWLPHPSKDVAEAETINRSQMKSMLQDQQRNNVFASAITSHITSFKATHGGRSPKVLDIGSGTGLLSLLAANAGAASPVISCEQFPKMAQIASSVIASSSTKTNQSIIEIKAIHSSALEASLDSDAKFDLIVHEILDSSLFGEGVIPALRDAYKRLCKDDAKSIPHSAILRARLIYSDQVKSWHDTSDTYLRRPSLLYARKDWTSKCEAVVPAIPVHSYRLSSLRHISREFIAATVEFSKAALESTSNGYEISSIHVQAEEGIDNNENANAVLFYWDLHCQADDGQVYSTSPNTSYTNWQDHWTQCLYPLSSPVAPTLSISTKTLSFTVATCRTDTSIAFFAGPADCAIFPSKRSRSLLLKSPKKSIADYEKEKMPALIAEPQPCSCGLHTICSHERRWMLADETRMIHLSSAIDALLLSISSLKLENVKKAALEAGIDDDEDGGGRDIDLRVLGLGDGSITGLLSATSPQPYGIRIVVFSLESSGQPSAVHAAACAAAAGVSDRLAVLTHAAFEASPQILGAAEAEMSEEGIEEGGEEGIEGGEGEEQEQEQQTETLEEDFDSEPVEGIGMGVDGFAIAFASDALTGQGVGDAGNDEDEEPIDMEAAESAALVHGTRSAQAEVLLCEPYFAQLSTAPPSWTLAAVWMRRSVLQRIGTLTDTARVLPSHGVIYAQSVRFKHLHKTFGSLSREEFPCNFDHTAFNKEVEKAPLHTLTFAFPLWQYEYDEVSIPVEILKIDIEGTLSPLSNIPWGKEGSTETMKRKSPTGTIYRCGSEHPISLVSKEEGEEANAVIFWVDYTLDKESRHVLSTHSKSSPFARQGVRFCKGIKAASWFDEERGTFELWAE
jgi:hypothetical protein